MEAICSEFPAVRGRLHLFSELADGFAYDIPDPADSGINPNEVGREIFMLTSRGKEKILRMAETLCKSRVPEREKDL